MADALRIDKWLYYCRFFKTRTRATAAVTGGHVKLNGERPSAGVRVRCGDRIDLIRERLPYALVVTRIPARRGPASEAQGCYDEDPDTVTERERQLATLRQDRLLMPRTRGKPDKHTRSRLRERKRR